MRYSTLLYWAPYRYSSGNCNCPWDKKDSPADDRDHGQPNEWTTKMDNDQNPSAAPMGCLSVIAMMMIK